MRGGAEKTYWAARRKRANAGFAAETGCRLQNLKGENLTSVLLGVNGEDTRKQQFLHLR